MRYCKKILDHTLKICPRRYILKIGPFSKKKKFIIQKISDRNERNFQACVVIIGGICVLKIKNLADKL